MKHKNDAPFQIKRTVNIVYGGFDYQLIHTPTGKLVVADYRVKSPIPPKHIRQHQARLNTQAVLDGEATLSFTRIK